MPTAEPNLSPATSPSKGRFNIPSPPPSANTGTAAGSPLRS